MGSKTFILSSVLQSIPQKAYILLFSKTNVLPVPSTSSLIIWLDWNMQPLPLKNQYSTTTPQVKTCMYIEEKKWLYDKTSWVILGGCMSCYYCSLIEPPFLLKLTHSPSPSTRGPHIRTCNLQISFWPLIHWAMQTMYYLWHIVLDFCNPRIEVGEGEGVGVGGIWY